MARHHPPQRPTTTRLEGVKTVRFNRLHVQTLVCAALTSLALAGCGEGDVDGEGEYDAPLSLHATVDDALEASANLRHEARRASPDLAAAPLEVERAYIDHSITLLGDEMGDGFYSVDQPTDYEDEYPTHWIDGQDPFAALGLGDVCTFSQEDYLRFCEDAGRATCVLEEHFDMLYPDGLKVTRGVHFEFTEAAMFVRAMPATGKAERLHESTENPRASEANRLAMELAVLEVNMDLNEADKLGRLTFANIKMGTGPVAGLTVREIADLAHWILDGNEHLAHALRMTLEDYADLLAMLNVAGKDCVPATYIAR